MKKSAKILLTLIGVIIPIMIGLLHTYVHFNELLTPEIENYLQKEVLILGEHQKLWSSWGLVSFMMGLSFVTIGILNLTILRSVKESDAVPQLFFIAMLIYLGSSVYVGIAFQQSNQFYGGLFGITVLAISWTLNRKG